MCGPVLICSAKDQPRLVVAQRDSASAPTVLLKSTFINGTMLVHNDACMSRIPRAEEVEAAAIELAQVLLSNRTWLYQYLGIAGQYEAKTEKNPPSFALAFTIGCAAHPVSFKDCCAALAAHLLVEECLGANAEAQLRLERDVVVHVVKVALRNWRRRGAIRGSCRWVGAARRSRSIVQSCALQSFTERLLNRVYPRLAHLVCSDRLVDDVQQVVNVGFALLPEGVRVASQDFIRFTECCGLHGIVLFHSDDVLAASSFLVARTTASITPSRTFTSI